MTQSRSHSIANLNTLSALSLLMKMLCWRCCLQRVDSSRKRLCFNSDLSMMFWYTAVLCLRYWREENEHKRSFREYLLNRVRSCVRSEKQRCSSSLQRISSFSMNLYSMRRQNDSIKYMSQLTSLFTILLILSETVHEAFAQLWQSMTIFYVLRSKKTTSECLIFLIDCNQCFFQLSVWSWWDLMLWYWITASHTSMRSLSRQLRMRVISFTFFCLTLWTIIWLSLHSQC